MAAIWQAVLERLQTDASDWDRWALISLLFLAHEVPLLCYQIMISIFRTTGLFRSYVIQPQATIPEPLMHQAVVRILFGHLVVQPVVAYLIVDLMRLRGMAPLLAPLPSLFHSFIQLVIAAVLCDTANYWSHRTLHHPRLYTRFHKQHHQFHSVEPMYVPLSCSFFLSSFFLLLSWLDTYSLFLLVYDIFLCLSLWMRHFWF
jgi:sterol desaturase/sphingolipid hydroxylase (fatty acid hydroxylase superfamily)